jgi:cell fate (sporulation/competence/biofilm development) regulator YlbF (YheA/YmcA/DUF963 family)
MDEILELASRLGKRIAQEDRGQRMIAARAALEGSLADRQLLANFEECQRRIQQLQMEGRAIEPEDKRKLVDLQNRVIASPVLKDLLRAQADFVELMAQVSTCLEQEALGGSEAK